MLKHLRNREDWSLKSLPEKGFTLVELLVVIVILGILAAVVVFAVSGSTTTAQSKSCAAELSAVQTGLEAYKASEGVYPTDISQLTSGANQYLRTNPSWYTLGGTSGKVYYNSTGKCGTSGSVAG